MAAETIIVYIDAAQLAQQKNNNYSLFLAKKVNGIFTVIWQSLIANAVTGNPAYEYRNTFTIAVPSYQLNYGTVTEQQGSVTFQAGGQAIEIDIGQQTVLSQLGIFAAATNGGTSGEIVVSNQLQDNPHVMLLDDVGNPIFVNVASGMDIGTATLTPIDEYQIWFDNLQETGTIIVDQVSNAFTVVFDGGAPSKTITYNNEGMWEAGEPASVRVLAVDDVGQVQGGVAIAVLATFKFALSAGAVTYLVSKLIGKFADGLRPTKITAQAGGMALTIEFAGAETASFASLRGVNLYADAVNLALTAAKKDAAFGLQSETWTIGQPTVSTLY